MGLATIDPHSHKVQTKLYKIPNFGVYSPKSKQDTANVKINFTKKCMVIEAVRHSVQMATHFFANFDYFKSLYLSQN